VEVSTHTYDDTVVEVDSDGYMKEPE